jgi:hypothetical protein
MVRKSPFEPSLLAAHQEMGKEPSFSARSFAVNRAGFLLREFERQQHPDSVSPLPVVPAAPDESAVAAEAQRLETQRVDQEKIQLQQRVDESYQRGRNEALAQLGTALDTALAALDEVGRELSVRQIEMEQTLVVPLAKAAIDLAGQLARQHLAEPDALTNYIEQVIQASAVPGSDQKIQMTVHLNPADIEILKRASINLEHLTLVADDLVACGGASLRALDQVVDDRFENRMREIRECALTIAASLSRRGRE